VHKSRKREDAMKREKNVLSAEEELARLEAELQNRERKTVSPAGWLRPVLLILLVGLGISAGAVVAVDPAFHYHAPLEGFAYTMGNPRYINDGIVRHFTYDTIITGSSMTENFLASECEELFGGTAVKVPFSGTRLRELGRLLDRAFASRGDIRRVILGLDSDNLGAHRDELPDYDYPEYLYDDKPLNDVRYLWNKEVVLNMLLSGLRDTVDGRERMDFDEYASWCGQEGLVYGREAVLSQLPPGTPAAEQPPITEEDWEQTRESLEQNLLPLIRENPDTEFVLFYTPYSIAYWRYLAQKGGVMAHIERMERTAELLLSCPNVRLYSFDNEDFVLELDNYKDIMHYGEWINSLLLQRMSRGENRLTAENCGAHFAAMRAFFGSYDYEALCG